MTALALTVALALPVHAHTGPELGDWYQDWLATPQPSNVMLAELADMRLRHPCFPEACFAAVTSPLTSASKVAAANPSTLREWPGDWPALVSTYFQPGDVEAALKVIQCESGFSLTAKNPTSSALGPWQFLRDTWDRMVAPNTGSPSYDAGGPTDPVWSTINAAWLWYNVGPSQWTCW